MSVFIVETIFERVYTDESSGEPVLASRLERHVTSFTDPRKEVARADAKREMDRVIRYGIKMDGASVRCIIHPSSIRQVGIVDIEKYQEESKAIQAAADAAQVAQAFGSSEEVNVAQAS